MKNYLKYKNYIGKVEFSEEDEVFYGKIHGINDLVNFEGNTVSELKQSFFEAVDDYLEMCVEVGKEPNKTFKGSFNVRISEELHKMASYSSAANDTTLNEFVKNAISKAVFADDKLVFSHKCCSPNYIFSDEFEDDSILTVEIKDQFKIIKQRIGGQSFFESNSDEFKEVTISSKNSALVDNLII